MPWQFTVQGLRRGILCLHLCHIMPADKASPGKIKGFSARRYSIGGYRANGFHAGWRNTRRFMSGFTGANWNNRAKKSKRALASPCLLTGFTGLSRGLRTGHCSGRNPYFGEDKGLKNYPDNNYPYANEDVVH